jgi:hypothetical protein
MMGNSLKMYEAWRRQAREYDAKSVAEALYAMDIDELRLRGLVADATDSEGSGR